MSDELNFIPKVSAQENVQIILRACGQNKMDVHECIAALEDLAAGYEHDAEESRKLYWNERADHIKTEKERDKLREALKTARSISETTSKCLCYPHSQPCAYCSFLSVVERALA